MKKTNTVSKERLVNVTPESYLRRLVRHWFSSLVKHQNCDCLDEITEKLQDIEDTIEIIAREMYRQGNKRKK